MKGSPPHRYYPIRGILDCSIQEARGGSEGVCIVTAWTSRALLQPVLGLYRK